MASLNYGLKEIAIKKKYQFITYGCSFYPGLKLIDRKSKKEHEYCNKEFFAKLNNNFSNDKESIIVLSSRLPLHISGKHFDNQEGGKEQGGKYWNLEYEGGDKIKTIKESLVKSLENLSKKHKIILIYPIPEVGWNVPSKIHNYIISLPKNINKKKLDQKISSQHHMKCTKIELKKVLKF